MRIEFCGAARDVTGSQYLADVNGHRFLLECGMYQGRRADAYDRNLNFHYDIQSLESVILSHAHIDHSGNLPNLVKQGYKGLISLPQPSRACDVMLPIRTFPGSGRRIRQQETGKRNEPPIEPIYTAEMRHVLSISNRPVQRNFLPCPCDCPLVRRVTSWVQPRRADIREEPRLSFWSQAIWAPNLR